MSSLRKFGKIRYSLPICTYNCDFYRKRTFMISTMKKFEFNYLDFVTIVIKKYMYIFLDMSSIMISPGIWRSMYIE